MCSTVNISIIKNPLDPINSMDSASIPYDKEETIIEHIKRATGPIGEELVISLNGCVVGVEATLEQGDSVVFCPILSGGGDSGKTVLRMVAMVAVMVAAAYTGGAAATAYGPLIGGLTQVAVGIGGSLLINAILPPEGIDMDKLHEANFDRSTNYGWSAPSNAFQEGIVLPSLIGKRRFAPPRIGAYRYQPPDNSQQQYLRLLYALCDDTIEDLTEDDIFINGRMISDYPQTTFAYTIGNDSEDYSIKWFHEGTLTETQHSTNISEQEETFVQGVHYANFSDDVWQPGTPYIVNQNVEVINIRALFPNGLRHKVLRTVTKGKHEGRTRQSTVIYRGFKFVLRYRPTGETTWSEKEFTVHPENRYYKDFWRTFVLDGLTSGTYDLQFTVRESKNNPIEIKGVTGLSSLSTLPTITTGGSDVEKIGVGLMLPMGIYYVNDNGGFNDHTVKVGIDIRAVGETEWLVNHTEVITDHTSAQIRRYIAFDSLPANQYEIRVYVSGLLPTDTRYKHMVLLDYLQEGIEQHLVYRGVACLAVEVLATDALHNQYPTVEVIGQCSEYAAGRAANNPAWAAYYRLRYHDIDESKINLTQFQTWATFCTDNNLECNLYLDTQLNLQSVLNNISIAGRANVVNRGGLWGVIIDDVTIPKLTFTIDDIIEDSFEETFLPSSELANTVICWFFDEESDYRRTAVEVRDNAVTSGEDVKKIELTLYGVTHLEQATKHAKAMLNQTRLINRTVSWIADIDAINCTVGDVVRLQHDLPEWGLSGGRVTSGDLTSVITDTPNDFSDPETSTRDYRLCIRHQLPRVGENEDFIEVKAVNNPYALGSPVNENVTTFTLQSGVTWERIPESGSLISLGWITGTESSTGDELLSLKEFRIINIERYQEQQFKITAVEYYDDAYEDDYIVSLPASQSGLTKVDMIKVNSAWSVNGMLHTDYLSLSWVGNAPIYYIFYKTKQSGEWSEWRFYQSTGNTSLQIADLPTGQEYLFSVSTQNNPETGSQTNITHETADHVDIIQPITNIVCVQTGTSEWIGKDLDLSWSPFTMFSLKNYRVEILDVLNNVLRTELTGTERYLYTYEKNVEDHNGIASGNIRVRVTVIDQTDNEAASIVQVLTNNPPSVISNIRTSKGSATQFTGRDLDILWNGSTDEDFLSYEVVITHGSTDLRTEYVSEPFYRYTLAMNAEDGNGTPSNSIVIKIRVIDSFNQASGITSLTLVNPAPGTPQGLAGEEWMQGIRFIWNQNPETDISHYEYRLKVESLPWGLWTITLSPLASKILTESESIAYEGSADISIEVKTIDTFGTESGVATLTQATGSLDIPPTSITDFNQISSAFPKIPVIIGDAWTNNSPTMGFVSWNSHELWYNGTKYTIQANNTEDQYIYWLNGASSYSTSNEVPVLGDDSFIIVTNIDGDHDLAWNSLANEVIGSAFIKKAAIHDLHVSEVSANKLKANSVITPGVYIGGAKYGGSGTQPSIDDLKPAEGGATMGATYGVDVYQNDHLLEFEEMINNPSNLLLDSNFSKTQNGTDTTYWSFNDTTVIFRTDAGYNISNAAQLIADGSSVRLQSTQVYPWSPNKKLYSRGQIFVESTFDGNIYFGIGALDHNKVPLGQWFSYSIPTDPKHAWKTFEGSILTPTGSNTAFILIWFFITGTTGSVIVDELYAGPYEEGATVGANWSENLSSIPIRFADAPQGNGLYVTETHLGFYSGGIWKSYLQNNGNYYFGGDQDQYISWDGSALVVSGSLQVKNPSTLRSDINVERWASPTDSNIIIDPSFIKKVHEGVDYWIGNATFYPTHGENSVPAVQITGIGGHHYAKCDHYIPVKKNDKIYVKIRVFIEAAFDGNAQLIIQTFDREKNDLYNAPTLSIDGPRNIWFDWEGVLETFPDPICFFKPYFEHIGGTTNSYYISYFYLSKTESGANITETRTSADTKKVGGYNSDYIATSHTGVFRETFENPLNDFNSRWHSIVGSLAPVSIVSSISAITGGKYLRIGDNSGNDHVAIVYNEPFPFDPSKLYRIRIRIRRPLGSAQCALGVVGYNYDKSQYVNRNGLNQPGYQFHHVLDYGHVDVNWSVITGYIKGHGTYSGGELQLPSNAGPVHPAVRYISPYIDCNYPTTSGQYEIDEFSIDIIPENADQIAESTSKKWAGETGATNDTSWRHTSDATKINGGYIYTDTISLNSINGASGVLDITAGKINVATTNGIEVSGTGDINVLGGGDVIFNSTASNNSKLIFKNTHNTNNIEITYFDSKLEFLAHDQSLQSQIHFGNNTYPIDDFKVKANGWELDNISGAYGAAIAGGLSLPDLGSMVYMRVNDDYNTRAIKLYLSGSYCTLHPYGYNNLIDLGSNQYAWKDLYFYTPHDKCLYLDNLNDLKILHSMKPSKDIDPQCGLPKLDLNSLPRWMTNYETLKEEVFNDWGEMINDEDFDEFLKDEDHLGYRLFRKSGHFVDIVAGAVRALDLKLSRVIKHVKNMEKEKK